MLNTVVLQGRLTKDPELRTTVSGKAVTSFALAVQRDYAADGNPETDFIDAVAWGGTAEFVAKWFTKGMLVAVSGRLQTRNFEDKQGNKRKATEVIVNQAYFCEKKAETSTSGGVTAEFEEIDDDGKLPF